MGMHGDREPFSGWSRLVWPAIILGLILFWAVVCLGPEPIREFIIRGLQSILDTKKG